MLQYREAINYDLLTKTGHELNDVGCSLSWGALDNFLSRSDPDSALMRELNPDLSVWATQLKTNTILADIYDMLATLNANFVARSTGKAARKPKPYPRPGKQHNADNERHFGSGALPVEDLHRWIEEKRAQHARNSTSDHNSHTSITRSTTESDATDD